MSYFRHDQDPEQNGGKHLSSSNPVYRPLSSGADDACDEDILEYLKSLGLTFEHNCLVLTATQHYYYNEEDLRDIRTMVNLKRFNLIKNIDRFLHSLYRILQPGANFVGCFLDSAGATGRLQQEKSTGLLNWFTSFLEMKGEHKISRNDIKELLESHGFRIEDMKEINGLTYFYSKNTRKEKKEAGTEFNVGC